MRIRTIDIDAATVASKAAFRRCVSAPRSTPRKIEHARSSVSALNAG
jgi:hypothetical protein